MITLKTPQETAKMREAGRIVAEILAACRAAVRPGVTTGELDRIAADILRRHGATSNFKGYGVPVLPPFTGVICTSVNEQIVHGIPGKRRLKEGEIVSIIGPNGAGKSTLFSCITGFYRPNAGCIRYAGRDITRLAADRICEAILNWTRHDEIDVADFQPDLAGQQRGCEGRTFRGSFRPAVAVTLTWLLQKVRLRDR